MYNNAEMSNFIKELKNDLWIKDHLVRREILAIFIDGIKAKSDSIISAKSDFESILLKEWSLIRKKLMNMLWLGREIMESLDRFIINRNFLEAKTLFSSLRDFFIANYDTVDLVVYKHDKDKNSLTYFAWNKELDVSNIQISNNKYYKNEIASFQGKDPFTLFEETVQWWLYCKKIALPWWEDLVLSFHANTNIDIDAQKINMDIRRIIKLFQKNGLINDIKLTLSLINAKYKDPLTWAFNREYADTIYRNRKYSVIFIDVNDFKHVNDELWHAFWDDVLKEVVHILNQSIRDGDKVCRNWWDEFIVLVSSNDESILIWVESRIHKNISKFTLKDICSKYSSCVNDSIPESHFENKISLTSGTCLYNPSENFNLKQMLAMADLDMLNKKTDEGKEFRIYKTWETIEDKNVIKRIIDFFTNRLNSLDKKEEA